MRQDRLSAYFEKKSADSGLHWIEGFDNRGIEIWLRCLSLSHWGLFVERELPRWVVRYDFEQGRLCVAPRS